MDLLEYMGVGYLGCGDSGGEIGGSLGQWLFSVFRLYGGLRVYNIFSFEVLGEVLNNFKFHPGVYLKYIVGNDECKRYNNWGNGDEWEI